jgi:signal transduction histidine kinase
MAVHQWLRPPRQLLVVFLGIALISGGTLAWLGLQLLRQDRALETQRRRDRLEQSTDRAAASMQQTVNALDAALNGAAAAEMLPPAASLVALVDESIQITPAGSLPFVPFRSNSETPREDLFAEGERREFSRSDLSGARTEFHRLAGVPDPSIQGGALVRLARVMRKQHDVTAALQAYDRLALFGAARVDRLPAGLIARAGRATVFAENQRRADLVREAGTLQQELAAGRWRLTRSEYEFYTRQADEWAGTPVMPDADALARAAAVEWVWQNRELLPSRSRRASLINGGPAYVSWRLDADGLTAVAAGPTLLRSLCDTRAIDTECSLFDTDGRLLVGHAPTSPLVAVRPASAAGLPWTLHLADVAVNTSLPSPRRPLLLGVFFVVLLVLGAGWYFILRAIGRELRVSRLQSDFIAAVSHEFRSPLTSLSHIADMLAGDRFASDTKRRQAYEVLVRDTDRLRRLVEGLLEFGRMEAGGGGLALLRLDVTALVHRTVLEFEGRAMAEGFHVESTNDGSALEVYADGDALGRAIWNLLDNAVKYSPECRTVWVRVAREEDTVVIDVRDCGLGISPREQKEIFNRFVRGAAATSRRIKGTGIGLAMVREIVRAHGGEVRVHSESGKGSTFAIVLPCAGEGGPAAAASTPHRAVDPDHGRRGAQALAD